MNDENAWTGSRESGGREGPLAREYLLGRLEESEAERLRDRLLTDDQLFAEVEEAEADLLDDYARGELTAEERARLEERLVATPEGRRRARFAAALAARAVPARRETPSAAPAPSRTVLMAIAACLLLSFSTLWLGTQNEQLRRRLADGAPVAPAASPDIAAITLTSETTRGVASIPRLEIASTAEVARLTLRINPGEPYTAFAAIVRTRGGAAIYSGERLRAAGGGTGRAVTLWIPADSLTPGTYEIELLGVDGARRDPIGYYTFIVA
jgi:hypothetical protein